MGVAFAFLKNDHKKIDFAMAKIKIKMTFSSNVFNRFAFQRNLNKWLEGKKFGLNEGVISEKKTSNLRATGSKGYQN